MDARHPLVSVVIPAFNAAMHIGRALDSVLAQDYSPLEILVVDDGSTDDTAALVEDRFPFVKVISQSNAGVAAARNTGLSAASGELICFLDADDGWFPGKLHAQVSYLRAHPEVALVYHDWLVWSPESCEEVPTPPEYPMASTLPVDAQKSGFIYAQLLMSCVVHTSTVMMRRSVVEDIGVFDASLKKGEDYDYWMRVSQNREMHKLDRVYSYYRVAPGSLSTTPGPVNHEYEVVLRALESWGWPEPPHKHLGRRELKRRLAKMAFEFGYEQYYWGSLALASQAFTKAVVHRPWNSRAWLYLALARGRGLLARA
jgi:glycosyltransferase involved in cell wall biosynthesis